MSSQPVITPNVRIESPKVRKIIGNIFGWASLAVSAAIIVDLAIPAIDIAFITGPAGTIVLGLFGLFQTTITSPNVPTYA